MATWPADLPDNFLYDGFSEEPPDLAVRSQPLSGPALVRGRVSKDVTKISGRQIMTTAQTQTLDAFYENTLKGAAPFSWKSPRTGAAVSLRFAGRPGYTGAGPGRWYANITLEILP